MGVKKGTAFWKKWEGVKKMTKKEECPFYDGYLCRASQQPCNIKNYENCMENNFNVKKYIYNKRVL
jgi:hypothetical protein